MMRVAALLGVLALLVMIVGCGEDEPTEPTPVAAPTNLTIQVAGSDSLSVQLSWTAASGVDGYEITFEAAIIGSTTTTSIQHTPTSLGDYGVKSYKGSSLSGAVTVSTDLHEESGEGPVYYLLDPDTLHPSGYGWGGDGAGQTYSAQSGNSAFIDLLLDESDNLRSPNDRFGTGWNTTHIHVSDSTYATMRVAPTGPYYNLEPAVQGDVYVLQIESGHYLKMEITNYANHSMTFKFGFQTVAGFRRLG